MSAASLGKRCGDGVEVGQSQIALSDEQNIERLLETALPLVRPFVRRIKRTLPHNFEVDELENVAMSGLHAAARDYRPLQDGNFVDYAITRIRGAILDELGGKDRAARMTPLESRRLDLPIAEQRHPKGLSAKAQKKWLAWLFNSVTRQG
jgi:RNA polymerase sigma factor FliA